MKNLINYVYKTTRKSNSFGSSIVDDSYKILLTIICFLLFSNPIISQEVPDPEIGAPCNCQTGMVVINIIGSIAETLISSIFPNSNQVNNTCFNVTGTLVVDKDMDFTGCRFNMNGDAAIKIRNNSKFGIYSTTLIGCSLLWKGIELEDLSWISSISSQIYDARYAIYNEPGSGKNLLLIKKTKFTNNVIGIYCPSNSGGMEIGPDFTGNTFKSQGPLKGSPSTFEESWTNTGDRSYAGMVIHNSHFTIGKPNPNVVDLNKFSNLLSGISTYNNLVQVEGSVFENIPGDAGNNINNLYSTQGVTLGIGIHNGINNLGTGFSSLSVNGLGTNGFSCFNNVSVAINEYRGSCFVNNCKMTSVSHGVILTGLSSNFLGAFPFGSEIKNNRISCNNRAIFINSCSNNWIRVGNNDIECYPSITGIGIFLNANSNCLITVEDNIISISGLAGVRLLRSPNTRLINNNISLQNGVISNRMGFFIEFSPNSILLCNGVNSVNISSENVGFHLRSIDETLVECNAVSGTGIGYNFVSENMATDFLTNSKQNCATGIYLRSTAIIGPQEDKGNLFSGNFSIGARHDGSDVIIALSRFLVENTNTPDYPIGTTEDIYTPNGNALWYDIDFVSRPICSVNPNGCSPNPSRVSNNTDLFIAAWPTETDPFKQSSRYYAQRYLYRKLLKDLEYRSSDPVLANFFTTHINSEIGLYESMDNLIQHLFDPTNEELVDLESLNSSFENSLAALETFDEAFGEITPTTSVFELSVRSQILTQLQNLSIQMGAISNTISQRAGQQAALLLTQNNNLPATQLYTQNESLSNGVLLSMISEFRFEPTISEQAVLQGIADQCAYAGGRGVLKARSILTIVSDQVHDDEVICDIGGNAQANNRAQIEIIPKLAIYPIPVHQFLYIHGLGKGDYITCNLLSVEGKILKRLQCSKTANSFNLADLNPGVYFLEYEYKGRQVVEKLLIK